MTASELKYLLVIDKLAISENNVKCISIAKESKVSKASVHNAMKRLKNSGYILNEEKGVQLTEKGKSELCEYVYIIDFLQKHFLKYIHTSLETLYADALCVSCAFSEKTRKAIMEFINSDEKNHGEKR